MSDNCSTPKSKYKYKSMKESGDGNMKNVGIKFYPLGDNRKSRLSNVRQEKRQEVSQEDKRQGVSKEDKRPGNELKIDMEGQKIHN